MMETADVRAVNLTYEPFSDEPEYLEANRAFIGKQPLGDVARILDLACGNGVVSELLVRAAPQAHLSGIDYDPVQIDLIADRFLDLGYEVRRGFELTTDMAQGKPVAVFGVTSADDLPFPDASFDCVTIGNAIHMLPDKPKLLAAVQRVLRPGGVFGFNSSFYAGTMPDGTHEFYAEWLKEAVLYVDRWNAAREAQGEPRIKRVRGTTRKAFQNRWYSRQEWLEMLDRHGMSARTVDERVVMLNNRCFAAIGAYGGFADVLMSGYPVDVSSRALQATVDIALARVNATVIPRHWLEVWATKRQ
jgi:ubiquinone/menaquinone biosynthesis C-methylase UbiE